MKKDLSFEHINGRLTKMDEDDRLDFYYELYNGGASCAISEYHGYTMMIMKADPPFNADEYDLVVRDNRHEHEIALLPFFTEEGVLYAPYVVFHDPNDEVKMMMALKGIEEVDYYTYWNANPFFPKY